jgi:nitronate monooxygenase
MYCSLGKAGSVVPKMNLMEWNSELTDLLKITYPIVQAPMLGVTTPAMVAAVSNAGGLGSLPVGGLSPEVTRDLIRQTKALTDKPFAVNLFVYNIPNIKKLAADAMQQFLEKLAAEQQATVTKTTPEAFRFYSHSEQIPVLLEEAVPVVSFTFGVLDGPSIKAFHDKGVVLIGTATCLLEALILSGNGIDIITAQGIEAGGHRGTFVDNDTLPAIGLLSLLSLITSQVKQPVLAAGGIMDGKAIKGVLALGAAGVQMGTAFIASTESTAIPSYKAAIQQVSETDIVLTRAVSGRWARGIRNKLITTIEQSGIPIPVYPVQGSLTAPLRAYGQAQDNKEFIPMWAGQAASKAKAATTAEIFTALITQVSGG